MSILVGEYDIANSICSFLKGKQGAHRGSRSSVIRTELLRGEAKMTVKTEVPSPTIIGHDRPIIAIVGRLNVGKSTLQSADGHPYGHYG